MKKETKQNKKTPIRITVGLFAFALLLSYLIPMWSLTVPVAAYDATEDKQAVQKMEEELAALKGTSSVATQAYKDALSAYEAAEDALLAAENLKIALDKEIAAIESELEKTNELLNVYNEQIVVYSDAIEEKEAEIEERYTMFLDRVRVNYEGSFTSYLQIVLSSDSFSDLLYRVDVVAALLEYDKRVLRALEQSREDLTAMQTEYQVLQYSAQETLKQLAEEDAQLEKKRQENTEMLAKLEEDFLALKEDKEATEAEKNRLDTQVRDKEKRVAAAEAEIERKIREAAEKERLENYVGGKLGWPTDIRYNVISSPFTNRINPVYGYREHHNGIDIPCAYGSPIYAANSGTVIISEYHYSYGYYVVVDHGGGISTLYAHNSKLLVSVGQKVSKGQQLAKAGSTGTSTGNHCHFMVRENGTPVDPMGYVVKP